MQVRLTSLSIVIPTVLTGVGLLAGCGAPLVNSEYPGEPLLTLTGSVENPLGAEPEPSSSVYLAWRNEEGDKTVAELIEEGYLARTDVQPTFPADFTLELFTLPPESSFSDVQTNGNGLVAIAQIAMMNEEQVDAIAHNEPFNGTYGRSDAFVFFVPDGEDPNALGIGGAKAGFNLFVPPPPDPCYADVQLAYDTCAAGCSESTPACYDACDVDDFDCSDACFTDENNCHNACSEVQTTDFYECPTGPPPEVSPIDTSISITLAVANN